MRAALTMLGTVLGLIPSVVTIVGWVTTSSFREAVEDVVPAVGLGYVTLGMLLVAADPWVPVSVQAEWWPRLFPRDHAWQGTWRFKGMWTASGLVLAVFWLRLEANLLFTAFGFLVVVLGVLVAFQQSRRAYLRHKAAHKRCPDCAELVKVRARVCRYCGWRFEPRPPDEYSPRTHSPSNGGEISHETPHS